MKHDKTFFESVAILVGCIIGAGVLGIPYVVAQAGFLVGAINVIVIGLAILLINLYVGEISLRTKGKHQLTGYAQRYLGKWGKRLMLFAMIFGIYGALIAYAIGEGQALQAIFGGNAMLLSLIFFFIFSALIYRGLKMVGRSELILNIVMLCLIILITAFAIFKANPANLVYFDFGKILLPYGVILFAFIGAAAIPEVKQRLKMQKKNLKKAVILGSVIPVIIYFLFALAVVSATGLRTTEIATIGLGQVLGQSLVLLGNLFAIFSMATSFLVLGLALMWVFRYDYGMKKINAFALVTIIPLIVVLARVTTFIQVIGITGAIAGGVEGILIVLMANKVKKLGQRKPEYKIRINTILNTVLIIIFIIGIVYTVWNLFI